MKMMTVVREEAPANFVPAAAVIRRELALFGMIGCKEFVDCIIFVLSKKLNLLFKNAFNTILLEYSRGK